MIHPKVVVPRFPYGIRRVRMESALVPAGTAALRYRTLIDPGVRFQALLLDQQHFWPGLFCPAAAKNGRVAPRPVRITSHTRSSGAPGPALREAVRSRRVTEGVKSGGRTAGGERTEGRNPFGFRPSAFSSGDRI